MRSEIREIDLKAENEFRKVRPVSYTHLRAHETVLDIVCRLLLEKKQLTTPTQVLLILTDKYNKHDQIIDHI